MRLPFPSLPLWIGLSLFIGPGLGLAVSACDSPGPGDAGLVDGGMDASRRDAGQDAGPPCTLECEGADSCCAGSEGAMVCTNTASDIENCGLCGIDCVETGRGDACRASQCACGEFDIGCLGNRTSFCCPPRTEGGLPYCANLERDIRDCDSCGNHCAGEQADRCFGGTCICGEERRACAGTSEDLCCLDIRDVGACVDTLTDTAHCGSCRNSCGAFERCEEGVCSLGPESCEGGCGEAEMCCRGVCCDRALCELGLCGSDAGVPDAGPPDAGPPDGGV